MMALVIESRMFERSADSPIDRFTRWALWIITAAWPQRTDTGSRFIRATSSAISVTSQTSAPTEPTATRSGNAVIQPLAVGDGDGAGAFEDVVDDRFLRQQLRLAARERSVVVDEEDGDPLGLGVLERRFAQQPDDPGGVLQEEHPRDDVLQLEVLGRGVDGPEDARVRLG